jgi:diguanylate cyclase (GGDEF)-like protein
MISLKRYLEQSSEKLPQLCADAHVTMLEAIAAGALRCCPPTGEVLQRELSVAADPLKHERNARVFKSSQQKALKSLRAWGEESEAYFRRKTAEVKEMLTELANTAESIGKRDRRYTQQFHEITSSLQTIAQLDDLGRIKSCVLSNAGELKGCVDRMVREGNESIAHLEASLASHRVALDQAQELASLDPLTGLYNRREVEARIARSVTGQEPFCVVVVDLNNFKRINDQHGHLAGDELLRQIAHELRMASRAQDVLGRWGGDEFVMVIDGNFTNTKIKIQRMRPWVFGTYELDLGGGKLSIVVSASIGMAEWAPGETILQVLKRADADMYRDKGVHR